MPHQDLRPDGAVLEVETGETAPDVALHNGIKVEHACEKSCACITCHCIMRESLDPLSESIEEEDDMLDEAWGLESESRLSCQARVIEDDLMAEVSRHTINRTCEH